MPSWPPSAVCSERQQKHGHSLPGRVIIRGTAKEKKEKKKGTCWWLLELGEMYTCVCVCVEGQHWVLPCLREPQNTGAPRGDLE